MSHYVIVDGVLQRSTPETKRWCCRASQAVPVDTITEGELYETLKKAAECDHIIGVHRSDYQKIQDLEETE